MLGAGEEFPTGTGSLLFLVHKEHDTVLITGLWLSVGGMGFVGEREEGVWASRELQKANI